MIVKNATNAKQTKTIYFLSYFLINLGVSEKLKKEQKAYTGKNAVICTEVNSQKKVLTYKVTL